MKKKILCALLVFIPSIAFSAEKPLLNVKIEGAEARKLSDLMKDGGGKKEPFKGIPNDVTEAGHPKFMLDHEMVYRTETVACQGTKCDPFTLDAEKSKAMTAVLKKAGVEVIKPQAKGSKPLVYAKEIVCGAVDDAKAPVACYISAHFVKSKKAK